MSEAEEYAAAKAASEQSAPAPAAAAPSFEERVKADLGAAFGRIEGLEQAVAALFAHHDVPAQQPPSVPPAPPFSAPPASSTADEIVT